MKNNNILVLVVALAAVILGTGCAGMDHRSYSSHSGVPSSWNILGGSHTEDSGFREEWNTTDTLRGRGGVVLESFESRGKVGRDERTAFFRNADGSTTVIQAGREASTSGGYSGTWVSSGIRSSGSYRGSSYRTTAYR